MHPCMSKSTDRRITFSVVQDTLYTVHLLNRLQHQLRNAGLDPISNFDLNQYVWNV